MSNLFYWAVSWYVFCFTKWYSHYLILTFSWRSYISFSYFQMSFHFGYNETILFDWWSINNIGGLIGSMIGIFILAMLYEGLKYWRWVFWVHSYPPHHEHSGENWAIQKMGNFQHKNMIHNKTFLCKKKRKCFWFISNVAFLLMSTSLWYFSSLV